MCVCVRVCVCVDVFVFMVRESTRNIGDFVLSLVFQKAVQHYIVKVCVCGMCVCVRLCA